MSELRCGAGRAGGQPEPPYVLVAGRADDALVRAALAGIEEEGVPSRVAAPQGVSETAARAAARAAPLEVGLAVVDGTVCLTHAKYPDDDVVDTVVGASPVQARRLGHNAARIVVSVPLRTGDSASIGEPR